MQEKLREGEVYLKKFMGEYFGTSFILKKSGYIHCTNQRLIFTVLLGESSVIIEYKDIFSIKKQRFFSFLFGVIIKMNDGEKLQLRITERNSFMNTVSKYIQ